MTLKISVTLLALTLFAACGKDDSGLNRNKSTSTPVAQSDDGVRQGPVPESGNQDDQALPSTHKKAPEVAQVQEPIKEPEVVITTTTTPDPVVVTATPAPTVTPVPQDAVVGLGSTSQNPEDFLSRGYPSALLDARFCSISGKFSSGSRCYVVYQNGRTQMADVDTRAAIEGFIVDLQAKASAEKAAKAEKKSKKHKKNKK